MLAYWLIRPCIDYTSVTAVDSTVVVSTVLLWSVTVDVTVVVIFVVTVMSVL